MIALSLFAAIFPLWIGVVCAGHWIAMSTWVVLQRTEACHTRCEEILFALVLGAIYVFSFFNAKDERTRYKYLIYYTFCFVENTTFIVVWCLYAHRTLDPENQHGTIWYFYPSVFGHYLMFFGGIFFMLVYYVCFHPTRNGDPLVRKTKQRQSPGEDKKDPPVFLDLREFSKSMKEEEEAIESKQRMSERKEEANGERVALATGDMTPSKSFPALDEADWARPKLLQNEHRIVRRTSSAPDEAAVVITPSKRSFKLMTGAAHR